MSQESDEQDGRENATAGASGAELATRPAEVLRPLDVQQVKQSMTVYQQGVHALLDDSDWQQTGDGRFVKKSGWRKIATWFNLSVEVRSQRVERDESGDPLRASVIARAIASNGRSMDGDGHCAATETRFARSGGRQKIENDLIATATTRAKNRAIADLVGMGAVSAEEVVEGTSHSGPPFGEAASEDLEQKLVAAVTKLVGTEKVVGVINQLAADAGGYLPRISARAVAIAVAAHVQQFNPEPADEAEPTEEEAQDGSSDEPEVIDGDAVEREGADEPEAEPADAERVEG